MHTLISMVSNQSAKERVFWVLNGNYFLYKLVKSFHTVFVESSHEINPFWRILQQKSHIQMDTILRLSQNPFYAFSFKWIKLKEKV